MALTRLQNIISSVEGRILYVNPDDFDATDAIDNKGNSPLRPFKTIARAVLEVARYSYVSAGNADDKFDQFTIMLYPGDHIVDNRPGNYAFELNGQNIQAATKEFSASPLIGEYGWSNVTKQYADLYKVTNSTRGGLIIPRGVSIIGLDLRKTKIRPKYVPTGGEGTNTPTEYLINFDAKVNQKNTLEITGVSGGDEDTVNDLIVGSFFEKSVTDILGNVVIQAGTTITDIDCDLSSGNVVVSLSKPHNYQTDTGASNVTVKIPYEDDNSRSAIFRITGGCYFWQFSIFDGDVNGIYTQSVVKPQNSWSILVDPQQTHTKLTVFEYASLHDLHVFYRRVSDAIKIINCEKIEPKIQENRIVGALSDSVRITKVSRNRKTVTVTLEEELNLTAGNFISIEGNQTSFITGNPLTNSFYIGQKKVSSVNSRSEFTFQISSSDESVLNGYESGIDIGGDITDGVQVEYTPDISAIAEIEIDTVESASPYIFNVSLRSTYGMCGMHADGSRATGFKSMVVAQYTGISLQKDDSAFFKFNEGTTQYINQAGVPYHKDINAIYKPLQRSYHVKASNRAVIQAVSVFAVGYADHFIAEDGGDMSITNSNSNFGSNAMRSIGFSDRAFNKDSLGRITHIIPPRNVESSDSNVYWEAIDTVLTLDNSGSGSPTGTEDERLYLKDRTVELEVVGGGTGFTNGTITRTDNDFGVEIELTVSGGVVQSATFGNQNAYGNLQPGQIIHISSDNAITGLPCELVFGGTFTTKAGEYTVGARRLNKDGSSTVDKIYVPLYSVGSNVTQEQYANIKRAGDSITGRVFDYDYNLNNWYINVDPAANTIYTTLSANTGKYPNIPVTPNSYIKRIVDERVDNDKIYRLRYETRADGIILPSYPQAGYVLQVKKGQNILGVGDRFTDGSNLLLINKRFLANETVARYLAANQGFTIPNSNQACIDDLIDIIEAVAYNLRYGGNSEVYDAASLYLSGSGATGISGEQTQTIAMINTYLKPMMTYIINNGQTSSPVNTPQLGSIVNGGGFTPTLISGEEQLINVSGGCANVISASHTLLDIVNSALTNGNLNAVTRTEKNFVFLTENQTFEEQSGRNIYDRITGYDYNDVYYVYEVEEVVPYRKQTDVSSEVPGVYYLTVLKGSIGVDTNVLPGNKFKFSQNTDNLYPQIDIDNVIGDPVIANSIADYLIIGKVKTTNGLSGLTTSPEDPSYSITKESISYFLNEYLNNELEWTWNSPLSTNSNVNHLVNLNNSNGSHGEIVVNLSSTSGSGEIRKISINPTREIDSIQVELRRPSTIRSGNHTFEYVGFGPGNYSTGFPIKQSKILSQEEQKYSQSLKEQGGIAFYSGLNSNGDLYIGNTIINAVTGKTTENQISELNSLTIVENFSVLGGPGNRIATNFQNPVNFINNIEATGTSFFSNFKLRNNDGFVTQLLNSDSAPSVNDGVESDVVFNTQISEGSSLGWIKSNGGAWKEYGLLGTEKIHSYKSGNKYVLNVGQDHIDISNNSTVNINYDLDVTTNQRIGGHLDIGVGATSAITSNTANKDTQLYIEQSWSEVGVDHKAIEIKLTNDSGSGKIIDAIKADGTSVFSVDKEGNVAIQNGSSYGLSARAFGLTLTTTNTQNGSNVALNIIEFRSSSTIYVGSYLPYSGGSPGQTPVQIQYGFETAVDIKSFTSKGSPANFEDFNNNSMLLFINGVLQSPFLDYYFDGTLIHTNTKPPDGSRIEIRCLAN